MAKNVHQSRKETEFALSALMEIPSQYKAAVHLNLLGGRNGNVPERVALPAPFHGASYGSTSKPSRSNTFQSSSNSGSSFSTNTFQHSSSSNSYYDHSVYSEPLSTAPTSTYEHQICPICLTNPKDMAFGCGHQTCCECGPELQLCPICRSPIETRIKLY